MSTRLVCDASALVALLLDGGAAGRWVAATIAAADVAAPDLMRYEVANTIRRHELADIVSADQAAQAHADLLDLPVEAWPYELVADRAWALRHNLSCYDASYVALAELLEATLLTLDERVAAAPGVRCTIRTPRTAS